MANCCLYALGHVEPAAAQFRSAVRLDPEYVEAWNNLGSMLAELGRLSEAAGAFRRALALVPEYIDARENPGMVLKQMDESGAFEVH